VDQKTHSVSQKNPLWGFLTFFPNDSEFLVQILHAYYTFPSTLKYKFLFNYLQLWRSYALLSTSTQSRGRQSPARGPNPAREFRLSGPRRLVSFNIKFGLENVPNDERLFSRWAWFSRTLIVNADRFSYTRWRVDTESLTLNPSETSLVQLGHFWWSWKIV